ncbi:hypothetical protein HJB53_30305 [Rhizobium lentis]|uniref:hypothetical protein n=1 Tax=Rhizobium lentis TaxID=1138194 RepID=UPI001C82DDC8|nr:hypothetical protein [Rhizobium lentis]MBX5130785.1 hypothetical protein [Rhizobium lentis]
MRRVGVLLLALGCLSGSAYGKERARVVDIVGIARNGDDHFQAVITGAGRGLEAANEVLKGRNQALLYCQPDIAITGDQHLRIVEQSVQKHPNVGELDAADIGVALLFALQQAFPCK